MIGLAPDPPDVVRVTIGGLTKSSPWSLGWTLWIPGATAAPEQAKLLLDSQWIPYVYDLFAALTTNSSVLSTYRGVVGGTPAFAWHETILPEHGVYIETSPMAVCVDLHGVTSDAGKRGHSVQHFPAAPVEFTDDGRTLNAGGYSFAQTAADIYYTNVNLIHDATFSICKLCTVRKVVAGVPLAHPIVSLWVAYFPSHWLGTLRRRVHLSR